VAPIYHAGPQLTSIFYSSWLTDGGISSTLAQTDDPAVCNIARSHAGLWGHQEVLRMYRRPPAVTASGEFAGDSGKLLWTDQHAFRWGERTEVDFGDAGGMLGWKQDGVTGTVRAQFV
jgi:hypothetical protein